MNGFPLLPAIRGWRRSDDALTWVERGVALLLTFTVLVLLVVRAHHAGALWRDECASVQLAQMPTLSDLFGNFQRESFPALFPLCIRSYAYIFGSSDAAFRILGLAVGLGMVVALWINSRLAASPPLLGLALLGLNTTLLVWGTGIRGYGIGSVAVVLTFGLIARTLLAPSRLNGATLLVVALAGVHLLFYNTILLAAFVLAALVVCLVRRRFGTGLMLAAISAVCVLSMLAYIGPFRNESLSTVVLQGPFSIEWFFTQLSLALGAPIHWMACVWGILLIGLMLAAAFRLRTIWSVKPEAEWDILLFAVIVPILSIPGYFIFLKIVSYRSREWYYLALVSTLAAVIDLFASYLCRSCRARIARLSIAVLALITLPVVDWAYVIQRQTNVDRLAQELEARAQPNDFIVVNPWMIGVTFNRYYHGRAHWETAPVMADHRIHRFDLLKEKMMSPGALDDLLERISATLRSNNRVWIVGQVYLPEASAQIMPLAPAPQSKYGWDCDAYASYWSAQLGQYIVAHASTGGFVSVPLDTEVNELENKDLFVMQGWRD